MGIQAGPPVCTVLEVTGVLVSTPVDMKVGVTAVIGKKCMWLMVFVYFLIFIHLSWFESHLYKVGVRQLANRSNFTFPLAAPPPHLPGNGEDTMQSFQLPLPAVPLQRIWYRAHACVLGMILQTIGLSSWLAMPIVSGTAIPASKAHPVRYAGWAHFAYEKNWNSSSSPPH